MSEQAAPEPLKVVDVGVDLDDVIDRRRASLLVPTLDQLPDPLLVVDGLGTIRFANERLTALAQWKLDDGLGRSVFEFLHPDDYGLVTNALGTVADKDIGNVITVRFRGSHGQWIEVELRGWVQTIDGEDAVIVVARDTADRHALDLDRGDEAVMRAAFENMRTMVSIVGNDNLIRSVNGAVTRVLGHDRERVRGRNFTELIHPDDHDHVVRAVTSLRRRESTLLEARYLRTDGEYEPCEFTVTNLSDDPVLDGYLISGQTAAALTAARHRVDFLAHHDNRTGLLNRDGFFAAARPLVAAGGGLGVLIVDVVKFRSINELYGEPAGDAVLSAVAQRIGEIRWPGLLAGRFGADEFVVALRSSSEAAIEMIRERIAREVAAPIVVDQSEINVDIRTASAFDERPCDVESVLTSASSELMRIKQNAPGAAGADRPINERRRQLGELRAALDRGEIQPFFQPIVDAEGRVIAVEALVRWIHPVRGALGVGHILPLAQLAGLATAVDQRVLDHSLRLARRLAGLGYGDVEVHVNVDPKVIGQRSFATSFLAHCESIGANPAQIVVELTETDLLAPGAIALDNLDTLRRSGTHISIDDFGTGYSSLSHLLELPVDGVKIDRRFVAGIDLDPAATNLTTAILGLSESLQLGCVAEGVEQPYQLDRLGELGCRAFQGWLFSAAVSADEVVDLLPRIDATAPADA